MCFLLQDYNWECTNELYGIRLKSPFGYDQSRLIGKIDGNMIDQEPLRRLFKLYSNSGSVLGIIISIYFRQMLH